MAAIERAPEMDVLLHEGKRVPLRSLYEKGPVALVFLRHLGCAFCSQHVAQLAAENDGSLMFVCMGQPEEAREYRTKHRIKHAFVCDPHEDLYREFGLAEGRGSQLINLHVVARGAGALLRGHVNRRSNANMRRLGGTFVICQDGKIAWSHLARDVSDLSKGQQVRDGLSLCCEEA